MSSVVVQSTVSEELKVNLIRHNHHDATYFHSSSFLNSIFGTSVSVFDHIAETRVAARALGNWFDPAPRFSFCTRHIIVSFFHLAQALCSGTSPRRMALFNTVFLVFDMALSCHF